MAVAARGRDRHIRREGARDPGRWRGTSCFLGLAEWDGTTRGTGWGREVRARPRGRPPSCPSRMVLPVAAHPGPVAVG